MPGQHLFVVLFMVASPERGFRCSDTDVRQARGSRGRSGTLSGPYMAVLAALRAALCEVQSFHENSRAHGSSQVSAAQESKLNQLVASVEQAASTVCPQPPSLPLFAGRGA